MVFKLFGVFSVIILYRISNAAPLVTIPDQDWGYVEVRPGAHMFWWLYGSTHKDSRDQKPLVMWLQGGPGGSSTGFGNFGEIGVLDVDLNPRNTSWVQAANILFVDNPVGTGYSYVNDLKDLTHNVTEIADDLVTLFARFLMKYHIFEELPFYIFCESYGGKMTATFGVALNEAIKDEKLQLKKFKGVALGDGWVSPMDSVKSWGPYLYAMSLINEEGLESLQTLSDKAQKALDDDEPEEATKIWDEMENTVEKLTDDVDFYNILNHNDNSETVVNEDIQRGKVLNYIGRVNEDKLAALMNGRIKKQLYIPDNVTWGAQGGAVFTAQAGDFMKDVISDVDKLLDSGIKVVIYSGQLDLIVDTMGTLEWIKKLKWHHLEDFLKSTRVPVYPPSGKERKDTGAFLQKYENFYFYWILKAGHMVPRDAGEMALEMLTMIISEE